MIERAVKALLSVVVGCALTACSGGGSHSANAPKARPLSVAQVRAMVEDYEGRLQAAYASGDPSHLADFLAGPQLQGNTATINILNDRHQHNVFHLHVDDVSITSQADDRIVAAVQDHTTDNAFVDTATGQAVNGGLPGPEAQSFVLFFDRNPHDGRWYWTGAQKQ
ncbi:MAG: hypothetical protein JO086_04655 [Acidimicrobiia bacterium]|nr:hypothetical protein [Acidimicrobiia bacterium]